MNGVAAPTAPPATPAVAVPGRNFDGRTVRVDGPLWVEGVLAAAGLTTGGDLRVDGGIGGNGAGQYTVGGGLTAHAITAATVLSRGDVSVRDALRHTRLTTTGRLTLQDGLLEGGDVAANGGIACRVLGGPAGVPTIVEAGAGRALRLLVEAIAKHAGDSRAKADAMRASGEAMLRGAAKLSAQERERATEILFEAGELEAAAAKLAAALERRRARTALAARAEIAVGETIHPGVTVRLGGVEAVTHAAVPGPVVLTPESLGDGRFWSQCS